MPLLSLPFRQSVSERRAGGVRRVEDSRVTLENENVERPFVKWLKENYPHFIALNLFKLRGFPDRLVIGPGRFVLFLEFKRPKARARKGEKLQRHYGNILEQFGFAHEFVNSKARAIERFEQELKAQKVPRDFAKMDARKNRRRVSPRPRTR